MDVNLDLLGDPIPEGASRRGRPQHIPTGENRNKVRMLLAFDWDDGRIARALRISSPTLRKHYFRELRFRDEARPALEAKLIETTIIQAIGGNASMMKQAMKLLERADLASLGVPIVAGREKAKAPKLGKKEQALQDALAPRTDTTLGELIARRQGKPN